MGRQLAHQQQREKMNSTWGLVVLEKQPAGYPPALGNSVPPRKISPLGTKELGENLLRETIGFLELEDLLSRPLK